MNTTEICLFVTICILLGIIAYLYRRIDDSNDLYNKTKLELEDIDKRRRMILLELADVQEKYRDLKKSQKNVLYLCNREQCEICSLCYLTRNGQKYRQGYL